MTGQDTTDTRNTQREKEMWPNKEIVKIFLLKILVPRPFYQKFRIYQVRL
jgi:hypothetical protein